MNQQFGPLLYTISIWALPAIIAITFHEAAHGFVARRFGGVWCAIFVLLFLSMPTFLRWTDRLTTPKSNISAAEWQRRNVHGC
jgi:ascorbate-specific PTS system EIIC-type component UlaA